VIIIQAIIDYLNRSGYSTADKNFYSYIALWSDWYKGRVASFHNYRQYNGRRKLLRTRYSLGMAKTIAEDWANLLLNEHCRISTDNSDFNRALARILEENDFRTRANRLLETSFALGTGAFVEYVDSGNIVIDYIRAGMIFPLRWCGPKVTDCAFASVRHEGKTDHVYLNVHEKDESGRYIIRNRMFILKNGSLTPEELPEGLLPEIETGSETPFFQLISPNLANNLSADSPLGLSVYANALDQLEGLDLVYDSYVNEFRLGKKRIIIPISMARAIQEEGGIASPAFDDNDVEFYALELGEGEGSIREINMELRSEAHEHAIKTALDLLSSKCGLGSGRYLFREGGAKTATEVISERSELFQSLKKHELGLSDALKGLVKAIAALTGFEEELKINIFFDDSIIQDKVSEQTHDRGDVAAGLMQKWEYRVKWYGETKEEAMEKLKEEEPKGEAK